LRNKAKTKAAEAAIFGSFGSFRSVTIKGERGFWGLMPELSRWGWVWLCGATPVKFHLNGIK
jgi:hypothetical protein